MGSVLDPAGSQENPWKSESIEPGEPYVRVLIALRELRKLLTVYNISHIKGYCGNLFITVGEHRFVLREPGEPLTVAIEPAGTIKNINTLNESISYSIIHGLIYYFTIGTWPWPMRATLPGWMPRKWSLAAFRPGTKVVFVSNMPVSSIIIIIIMRQNYKQFFFLQLKLLLKKTSLFVRKVLIKVLV